jgi:hypothetical protein
VDNIVAITFTNVQVQDSSTTNATISGTISVDYTTGTVTGNLVSVISGVGLNYYYNTFQLTSYGSTYVVGTTSVGGTSALKFLYSGQQPATLALASFSIQGDLFTNNSVLPSELSDKVLNPYSNDLTYASTASGFNHFIDLYNFEASYPDLIAAFGLDQQAMQNWYNTHEPTEQRIETFDGLDYVASYPDLINAFASAGSLQVTQDDGAKHYITNGLSEGRMTTFNGLDYIASYPDLIAAFGANSDAGTYHYIEFGHNEGRTTTFDGLDYIASYGDLIAAFGTNEQAGAAHFITYGVKEGRTTTFDGLSYIADYTDLMTAFGANNDAGAEHYITNGFNEPRSTEFTFTDGSGTFSGAAAVSEYEKDFPITAGFGKNDDAFFTAYIDTYKSTGKFLGRG